MGRDPRIRDTGIGIPSWLLSSYAFSYQPTCALKVKTGINVLVKKLFALQSTALIMNNTIFTRPGQSRQLTKCCAKSILYQKVTLRLTESTDLLHNAHNKQTDKPVGDMARAYTGDADAVIDYGLLIAT